jgi:hypothetical protein
MCANQRSKNRDQLVGAYVTRELKAKIVEEAHRKGMTLADYIRWVVQQNTNKKGKHHDSKD